MEDAESPLQRDLDRLTKQVTIFAMCMGLAFFALSLFVVHEPFAQSFIFALGMVVAFIPEGLLPTVTLSLAHGGAAHEQAQRPREEAQLRPKHSAPRASSAPTRPARSPKNEMTVNHLWTATREYEVTGVGYAPEGTIEAAGTAYRAVDDPRPRAAPRRRPAVRQTPACMRPRRRVGATRSTATPPRRVSSCPPRRAASTPVELERRMPRVKELPFESRRKRMTTVHSLEDPIDGGEPHRLRQGRPQRGRAPRGVHPRRREGHAHDRGAAGPHHGRQRRLRRRRPARARRGLPSPRLRGGQAGRSGILKLLHTPDNIECHLTFVGLEVMMDPPRPEVAAAVGGVPVAPASASS